MQGGELRESIHFLLTNYNYPSQQTSAEEIIYTPCQKEE